ncbi:MAG: hypothetical protein RL219_1165 [Actinomycetota bacterium]
MAGGDADRPEAEPNEFVAPQSRRRFLALMAGGAGATIISPAELAAAAAREPARSVGPALPLFDNPTSWTFTFSRAADLIDLRFTFYNLQVTGSPERLTKEYGSRAAYIVVEFPPQHVAEEALHFQDPAGSDYPDGSPAAPKAGVPYATGSGATKRWHRALPLRSRIGSPSRLAFEIDPTAADVPFTESGLLNWTSRAFTPALVAEADVGRVWTPGVVAGPSVKPLAEPRAGASYSLLVGDHAPETAIEFPYGLILTPTSFGRWLHSLTPVTHGGRTEVWSSALRDVNLRFVDFGADRVTPNDLDYDSWSGYGDADLRAVWTNSPDYDPLNAPEETSPPIASPDLGFVTLPGSYDRWQLVGQTTYKPNPYAPTPPALRAKRFRMSSIGATVDMSGDFEKHIGNGYNLGLINYVHRAFAGRDYFVKVVYEGYLYPTLHRAAEVTVSERVFITPTGTGASTGPVAYLHTYTFIVVKEKHRTYGGDDEFGRRFPFTTITIDTESTPPIAKTDIGGTAVQPSAYFPTIGGEVFRWSCTVTDQLGQQHRVQIPLAFARATYVDPSLANRNALANAYDAYPNANFRLIKLDGLRIGFAPEFGEDTVGKTSFPTFGISFKGLLNLGQLGDLLGDLLGEGLSFPAMDFAAIKLDGLGDLAGIGGVFGFRFPDVYLGSGFGDLNAVGKVFARMFDLGSIPSLDLPSIAGLDIEFPDLSQIGGLISPNFSLTGLSAVLGTFGGNWPSLGSLPDLISGVGGKLNFNPADWFSGFPKILGGIELPDILGAFSGGSSLPSIDLEQPKIPGLTTEIIYKTVTVLGKSQKIPIGMTIKYRWSTTNLKNSPLDIFQNSFTDEGPNSELIIAAEATVKYDVSASDFTSSPSLSKLETKAEARAELKNFRVNLIGIDEFGFITLQFSSLTFSAKTGAGAKVEPNLANVEFKGALEYIMELRRYLAPESGLFNSLPSASGGDVVPLEDSGLQFNPIFDVSSSKVAVGFTLGLPTLAVGVFSLSNLEVGMLITLPFNSDPMTAKFNVSRKDRPFLLTVGIFGGSGFFGIELGLNGIRSLEISLEFGAAAQFDIGIASGSVSVMAGIYFGMRTDPDEQLELSGFVRLNGRVEVLCIITISIEFLLTLSYVKPPGVAKGRAELTVTVEVAFFSKDVTMTVEKEFGGNSTGASVGKSASALAAPGGPVRYADLMSQTNYDDYVGAFA